jgi:hypothetical protein
MDLGWKVLIPVALVWTMVTAAMVLFEELEGGLATEWRIGLVVLAVVVAAAGLLGGRAATDTPTGRRGGRGGRDPGDDDGTSEHTPDREEVTR